MGTDQGGIKLQCANVKSTSCENTRVSVWFYSVECENRHHCQLSTKMFSVQDTVTMVPHCDSEPPRVLEVNSE